MNKILFINIDPNKVKDVQSIARRMRGEWDITLNSSAKAALNLMGKEAIDVIVAEIQPPDMSGLSYYHKLKIDFLKLSGLRYRIKKTLSTT